MNISTFVKNHLCLTICTLGLSVIGYLGYRLVRYIVKKCQKTAKINDLALKNIRDNNPPKKESKSNTNIDLTLQNIRNSNPPKKESKSDTKIDPALQNVRDNNPLRNELKSDTTILEALKRMGFKDTVRNAADGNCLFLSIAPQVTKQDLEAVQTRLGYDFNTEKWLNLPLSDRAACLRNWAMIEEVKFFSNLPKQFDKLSAEDAIWIEESYKDFLQELENCPANEIPERIRDITLQQKLQYVKNNYMTYTTQTSRPQNWAGTTEYIALSRFLNRQIEAFGYDRASAQLGIRYDANGRVEPYYRRNLGRVPPFTIFQCGGGGHYEYLPRETAAP